jgi:hypothetical protein
MLIRSLCALALGAAGALAPVAAPAAATPAAAEPTAVAPATPAAPTTRTGFTAARSTRTSPRTIGSTSITRRRCPRPRRTRRPAAPIPAFLREIRLDSRGRIFKINDLLTCGDVSADRTANPFICDAPMDMRWGPDGDFYLLSYGDGFFRANTDALLVKFSYVKGTRAPTAKASATPANGPASAHRPSAWSQTPSP